MMSAAEDATMATGPRRDGRRPAVTLAGFCAFLDMYATQPLLPIRVFHATHV